MSAPTPATHCQLPIESAGSSSMSRRSHSSHPRANQRQDRSRETRQRPRARADASIPFRAAAECRRRRAESPFFRLPRLERRMRRCEMKAVHLLLQRFGLGLRLNQPSCRKKSRMASDRRNSRSDTRSSAESRTDRPGVRAYRERCVRAEIVPNERCAERCDVPPSLGTFMAIEYCIAVSPRKRRNRSSAARSPASVIRSSALKSCGDGSASLCRSVDAKRISSGASYDATLSVFHTSKYGAKARYPRPSLRAAGSFFRRNSGSIVHDAGA